MGTMDIERDEKMEREYIPLAAGYEWQTKGHGSTTRLLCPDGNQQPISWNPDWIRDALDECMRAQNRALAQHKQVIAELVASADLALSTVDAMLGAVDERNRYKNLEFGKNIAADYLLSDKEVSELGQMILSFREVVARAKALEVA